MCLATNKCFSSRTLPLSVEAHNTGSSEDRRRVMPAFPNNVPVVKALAGCTLLAGTRRWDCAGIPEAEGISRGSPSLRPAHHHPGPSQLDPNPGKELPRQDEMIIVIIVIIIIIINHHHLHQRPAHHHAWPAGGEGACKPPCYLPQREVINVEHSVFGHQLSHGH